MQILKRLIIVSVCFVIILSSFTFISFGVYSAEDHQMMLDEGFTYDPYLDIYYIDQDMAYIDVPSTFLLSSPNYPDFEPNMLPWESAPDYIKDILYDVPFMPTTSSTYPDNWKDPFVVVVTNGSLARVIVGVNLFLATYYSDADAYSSVTPTGVYVMCRVLTSSSTPEVVPGTEFACCYEAYFDVNTLEPTIDWRTLSPSAVGSFFSRFTGNLCSLDTSFDFYCYGANHFMPYSTSSVFPVSSSDFYPCVVGVNDPSSGFAGSNCFIHKSGKYPYAYFTSFVPTTFEEAQLETSKGIWQTLKELPSTLMEKIEGFFNNFLNYILYFQADKPEHVNPFSDILLDLKDFFSNQISDVDDFKASLNQTLDNVVGYIESGSSVINTFLTAVPILSAFVTFFVVFFIVRKVIGR